MGASASVINTDGVPEDLKAVIDAIQRQKHKIAEYDTTIMEKEMNKMFKGHNQIIDELAARTKTQIRNMLEHCPQSEKYLDQLNDGGNQYAKFIKQLAVPKQIIEIEQVKASSHEYDEELLVDIIGTSSIKEIQAFDELLMIEKSYTLNDLVSSQCKKDSPLFRFFDRILKYDRDESKHADLELAKKQAEIIHRAGTARLLGVEEEPIFEILSTASRTQCLLISEVYQEDYKMKLERAINMKFKGNCGKLLSMWTQSIPQAIVTCIGYLSQKLLLDKFSVALLLAKYDKDVLSLADEACQNFHRKPLAEFLKKCLSGNLHRAVKNWIEMPSPDKGFEKIVTLYLENKVSFEYAHVTQLVKTESNVTALSVKTKSTLTNNSTSDSPNSPTEKKEPGDPEKEKEKENSSSGPFEEEKSAFAPASPSRKMSTLASYPQTQLKIDWNVLLQDQELYQKFKFLLEKQGQEIKLFMIDKKIKLDAADSALLSHATSRANSMASVHGNNNNNTSNNNLLQSKSLSSASLVNSPTRGLVTVPSFVSIDEENDEEEAEEVADKITTLKKVKSDPNPINSKNSSAPSDNRKESIFGTNLKLETSKTNNNSKREKEILSQLVYDFLLQYVEQFDNDDEGSFPAADFWRIIKSLPGELIGFGGDDLDTIQQFSSWENSEDGRIYYYEALFEFSESVIAAIENKTSGEKSPNKIVDQLTKQFLKNPNKKLDLATLDTSSPTKKVLQSSNSLRNLDGRDFQAASSKIRRMSTMQFPKVPIYFKQYLIDTLLAFDFDLNGYLTRNELESLGQAMNIPALEVSKFLSDEEESIEPKAASDIICGMVQSWFGDGEDHFICLVDKASGAYFWFNTKDESTQWADTSTA